MLLWLQGVQRKLGTGYTKASLLQFVLDTLASGRVVPGFGHAVLRKTDPRCGPPPAPPAMPAPSGTAAPWGQISGPPCAMPSSALTVRGQTLHGWAGARLTDGP